jgi:glutathionylspermidine synthase
MLEETTSELHRLCLEAVQHVIDNALFVQLHIPEALVPMIRRSWREQEQSLYGRFDLCYDGINAPKLLEYNADTPTSLLEAAVAQWNWSEETGHPDQFNSLHEKLIARWRQIAAGLPVSAVLHLSCVKDSEEDWVTTEYLRDTALQAGLDARLLFIEEVGWNTQWFVDVSGEPIKFWFKLYPWEWLCREEFGPHLMSSPTCVIEPLLWELSPGHRNLLPAYFEPGKLGSRYAAKPIYSREGANVELHLGGKILSQPGAYGAEGWIYQGLALLPEFEGSYPVLGCWVVGDEPAGMGIREDSTLITTNTSRFVPHYFD